MTDYIKHKEYKLPNGRTVTVDFNELGLATITIQAMDALFDILNSSWEKSNRKRQQKTIDVVEVVRCKDCKHNYIKSWNQGKRDNPICHFTDFIRSNEFYCGFGERAEE